MTKLTTGLAQELYDRYYIDESRTPKWIAEENGVGTAALVTMWVQEMGLRIRDKSESAFAWRQVGKPWLWDAPAPLHHPPSSNGSKPEPAVSSPPVHTITLPADGLPVKLLLVVGNVRLEIQVGK